MHKSQKVGAVVLAAGMSQRMGQLKALLPFGDRPMLARVLESLTATGEIAPILVVLGHAAPQIAPIAAEYRALTVANPDYAAGGMLSSVRTGVAALPSDCSAFFLVLGDQPGVSPHTLTALSDAWRQTQKPILLPAFEGRRGHPILLAAHLIPEILALPAEATLKTLITRHTEATALISVPDPAILADVDTPEDYRRALQTFAALRSASPPPSPISKNITEK